jgi:hypothetical protein
MPQGRLLHRGRGEGAGFRQRDVVDRPEETVTSDQDEVVRAELVFVYQFNFGA